MIFSSQLLQKDTDTLLKFKSHCIRSDYALSLVDKAIAANKKPNHHKDPGPDFIESDSNDTIEALDLTKKLLKVNPDDRYGNTGCLVFKRGIQIRKIFA